jgi:predicted LPLAT superfamily acyltransferase
VLKSIAKLYAHFFVFAQTLVDKMAIKYGFSHKYKFYFENVEKAEELMNSSKGAIYLGAHIGAWEVGAHIFSKYKKVMNVLMWDAEYQKIKELISKDKNAGYEIISINKDSVEAILKIKSALNNAMECSSDPLCWEQDEQLNLAACFSCCLVSETSCEKRNLGLDRRALVDEEFGFFKDL